MKALCCGRWSCHEPRCLLTCLFLTSFLIRLTWVPTMYLYVTFAGPCRVFLRRFRLLFFFLVLFISQDFLFFLESQPWLPSYFFRPLPVTCIEFCRRNVPQAKAYVRIVLPFLFSCSSSWLGLGVYSLWSLNRPPEKRKLNLDGFMSDRAAFIFSISLDIITRFMVLRLRERRTWGFIFVLHSCALF